jgi:single-stranded-DNA-specific exonuclease
MSQPLFDVSRSLQQARWVLPDVEMDVVERIARRHGLPEAVARLLCARGVAESDVEAFLYPSLRDHFPDPFSMKDMEAFAMFMADSIDSGKKIAIFGDFDVDGATSSALLYRFLKAVGVTARIYIPGRLTEGYGPNEDALRALKGEGADLVLLLDCGTTALETVAAGRAMGLEIAILDHHEPGETLSTANFTINPKRRDDDSGLEMLAACGVTFMACVAINNKLRAQGFYEQNGIDEPALKSWLDLVALGTVCDMVPLTGVNRLLVRTGFEQMKSTLNQGLKSLIEVSGIKGEITPYHAGFVLGPRINAGSRVHQSDLGARLLSTDDPEEAKNIAWTLNDCNDKRREIQAEMERAAVAQVEAGGLDQYPVIVVTDHAGHAGLVGLVAGRLKEKYDKPACVITYTDNAEGQREGRGSGRSVPGIHIARAFMDAQAAGLLEKGGGHAMAGGFTVLPEKVEAFSAFLQEHVRQQAQKSQANIDTRVDGILSVRGARADFVSMLYRHVGPFGQENPEPLFVISHARIVSADVVGENHVRAMISDWEGGPRIKAMAFRAAGTPLGDAFLKKGAAPLHIAGMLKVDTWNGRESVEMHVRDAAPAAESALGAEYGGLRP